MPLSKTYFLVFLSLSCTPSVDVHSAESLSLSAQRDDHRVRVVVCVADLHVFKDVSFLLVISSSSQQSNLIKTPCDACLRLPLYQDVKQQDFFVGTVRVNGRMDWPMLDSAVSQAFKVSLRLLLECDLFQN